MGKLVTVDSDDLKAVLFSTGVIKAVEGALKQHQDDPLVLMVKGDLEAAHNRLASHLRRAEREDRLKPSDEPLDTECIGALNRFSTEARGGIIWGNPRLKGFDGLRERGMVEFGVPYQIFHWSDSQSYTREDRPVQVARLTERGRAAYEMVTGIKLNS